MRQRRVNVRDIFLVKIIIDYVLLMICFGILELVFSKPARAENKWDSFVTAILQTVNFISSRACVCSKWIVFFFFFKHYMLFYSIFILFVQFYLILSSSYAQIVNCLQFIERFTLVNFVFWQILCSFVSFQIFIRRIYILSGSPLV